ncbi:putative glycerate kinase [Fervidobacterium pennivorans DSM 9078]|uniref:glycerate 2-kinase n=1 Tax=Fervidobacterium pennivorans (strain DSM 9078 / Ven5) TaxID=771875 RepID=H9UDG3_FERPD|nr:glycerate kinase [Fervidobacterium pennivorans]AFG35556.1 putative glycerate kinase [Fervidobacterium pennivorans DSM 9078]QIV78813.1 glycerate kinase [Fervidobacterium pennivorans subsp. keratinolyticus]
MGDRNLREDIKRIIEKVKQEILPDSTVKFWLEKNISKFQDLKGNLYDVAIGKAAWRMAKATNEMLRERISDKVIHGVVVTKYNHSEGSIENFEIYEAGHPIPDENTLIATKRVFELTNNLKESDMVLFLISGGGSALFELPMEGITLEEIQQLNEQLLKSGANIVEINTVRKHLSKVKGGRFAQHVYPAKIISLVLSDVLGDRLDSIASGPAYPDATTSQQAIEVLRKYNITVSDKILKALEQETPKELSNVETFVIGSVKVACESAEKVASELGYTPLILTTTLDCEAKEAGRFLASIAKEIKNYDRPVKKPAAIILGGETVVKVRGNGKGGRNQELALSFALAVEGLENVVLCSFGTDGTDGPTDAAGGIVDGQTAQKIRKVGLSPENFLENNDSYNALKIAGDLLLTGPTGTNVNDLIVLLVG